LWIVDGAVPKLSHGRMQIRRPSEIQIDSSDPWRDDDLDRRSVGKRLTSFLKSVRGPYVMAIHGSWGSGKTTFLRRMAAHLENQQPSIPVITIDAWTNDYLQDPLIAYIAAIRTRLDRDKSVVRTKAKQIASGLAKHGIALASNLVSIAASITAPGSVEVAKAVGGIVSKLGKDLLSLQDEHDKTQAAFSKTLAHARDALTGRVQDQEVLPLVVIVDELDRCRPSFAVSALERIKHFFNVEGVIFLIATDSRNISSAIASVYGGAIDAETYLRKFVEYEFYLPDPSPKLFVRYLARETGLLDEVSEDIDALLEERRRLSASYLDGNQRRKYEIADVVAIFPRVAEGMVLSLRDQIRAFTLLVCVVRTLPGEAPILPVVLCYGACLRFTNREVFRAMRTGEISFSEALNRSTKDAPDALSDFLRSPIGESLKVIAHCLERSETHARVRQIDENIHARTQHGGEDLSRIEVQRARRYLLHLPDDNSRTVCKKLFSSVELFAPEVVQLAGEAIAVSAGVLDMKIETPGSSG